MSTLKSNEEAKLSVSKKKCDFALFLIHVVISSQHRRKVPHWGSHTLTFLCLAGVLLAKSSRAKTDITGEMLERRKKTGICEKSRPRRSDFAKPKLGLYLIFYPNQMAQCLISSATISSSALCWSCAADLWLEALTHPCSSNFVKTFLDTMHSPSPSPGLLTLTLTLTPT